MAPTSKPLHNVEQVCSILERFGVQDDLDWLSVVLFVRNLVQNMSVFDQEQKSDIQRSVFNEMQKMDLDREKYREVVRELDEFVANNHHTAELERKLSVEREFSNQLVNEVRGMLGEVHTSQERQENRLTHFSDRTVTAVENNEDRSVIVDRVRSMLNDFLQDLKEEAKEWEERARIFEKSATFDPLLQDLYNRRALDNYLGRSIMRRFADDKPFSLIMIDVDHFKSVNDTFGHQVGDDLLKVLSSIVVSHAVQFDGFPARYGGEELSIGCPNMGLDRALFHADAIRSDVEEYEFTPRQGGSGETIRFTISAGVAELIDDWDAEDLVAAADKALYEAKAAGRNVVQPFLLDEDD